MSDKGTTLEEAARQLAEARQKAHEKQREAYKLLRDAERRFIAVRNSA